MTTKTEIKIICDICGEELREGFKFKSRAMFTTIFEQRGFNDWKKIDICLDCLKEIQKERERYPNKKTLKNI
jgi:hypothetical protein